MSRDVPFDETAVCDGCGALGAFDFMGDFFCPKCLAEDDAAAPQSVQSDEAYCTANCIYDPNKIGWLFCPYCGKRLHH